MKGELYWTDNLSGSSYRTGVSTATDGWWGEGEKGVVFNHFNKYRSLSNEVSLIDRIEARDIHTQHSTVLWTTAAATVVVAAVVDTPSAVISSQQRLLIRLPHLCRAELTNCVCLSVRLRPAGLFTCRARASVQEARCWSGYNNEQVSKQ